MAPSIPSSAAANLQFAKPDSYVMSEYDRLYFGVAMLDVTANDQGGKAKTLFSVDNDATPGNDLAVRDTNYATIYDVTTWETSSLGASYAIVDGKIAYDTSTLPGVSSLAVGETLTDTLTYAIRLGNGVLSYSTVSITITGQNDWPAITLTGEDNFRGTLFDDALDPATGLLSASGTVTVVDWDLSDNVNLAVTDVSFYGTAGNLTTDDLITMLHLSASQLSADYGSANNLTWTFEAAGTAFDYLEEGQNLILHYVVMADDGNGGTAGITISITV